MTDSKQHSNPNVISEAVRRNGYCGEVSASGQWVCVKDAGHEDEHGDERWSGDDFSLVRNYLFDGIGNDALTRIEEQYQTALDRLWEAHDQLCGCDRPADEGRCSAPDETWGAFEYLGERERVSNPTSGERVATGMPSRTSESSGASQSPEEPSPAKRPFDANGRTEPVPGCPCPTCQGLSDA